MRVLTGIDLVDIRQFNDSVRHGGERFLQKIFTQVELKNPDTTHLAGLFAAKEAIIKALSLKPNSWLSIEILSQKNGRPKVKLSNKKASNGDLSISHSGNYAVALFVALI